MSSINFNPGCYLVNQTTIVEIVPTSEDHSEIILVYASPELRHLFGSGTRITKSNQQLIELMSSMEFEPIDSTRAEVIAELYG